MRARKWNLITLNNAMIKIKVKTEPDKKSRSKNV